MAKIAGDRLLIEFPGTVQDLRFAMAIQTDLKAATPFSASVRKATQRQKRIWGEILTTNPDCPMGHSLQAWLPRQRVILGASKYPVADYTETLRLAKMLRLRWKRLVIPVR